MLCSDQWHHSKISLHSAQLYKSSVLVDLVVGENDRWNFNLLLKSFVLLLQ